MMTSPKPHPEKSRIGSGFAVSRRLQSVFGILTLVGGRAIRTTGIGSGSVGWPRLITLEGPLCQPPLYSGCSESHEREESRFRSRIRRMK